MAPSIKPTVYIRLANFSLFCPFCQSDSLHCTSGRIYPFPGRKPHHDIVYHVYHMYVWLQWALCLSVAKGVSSC